MKITLNNRVISLSKYEILTVRELLEVLNYTFPNIIVKVNGKTVEITERDTTVVKNDDIVDAIHIFGGG